jgi:hypothetical protein
VHRDTAKERRITAQHPRLVPKHENPHDMFERIADVFEPPTDDEHYTVLDGTKITKEYIQTFL